MQPPKRLNKLAEIITIENQKGGVGKTTLGYHYASYLAEEGYRVLAIDLDPQGNLSSRFLSREARTQGYRSVHLFNPTRVAAKPLTTPAGVDLIYALDRDVELANVERMDLGEAMEGFGVNITPLREAYDFIVIDTPPAHGTKLTAASVASTHMFIPVELAAFAVTGVESVLETLSEISHLIGRRIKVTGLIANRVRSVNAHTDAIRELREAAGDLKVLEAMLPTNGAIDDALREGVPVWKNKKTGARRESAKKMLEVMKEMSRLVGVKTKKSASPALKQAGVVSNV